MQEQSGPGERPEQRGWAGVTRRLRARLDESRFSEHGVLLTLSLVIGVGSGLGAVAFRWLISTFRFGIFFNEVQDGQILSHGLVESALAHVLGKYAVILVPAIGGLLVGPIIYFMAREAKGHGVPEVMEAVATRGGRIRARVSIVKALASSICIGSGGSVGREGPIVQIGSALGSALGQFLHLSDQRIRTCVACGAAGGIAATFNAPLAGVFFALEVIASEFTAEAFGTVVVSAVTASVVGRLAFGDVPAFALPHEYGLRTFGELPVFAVLGVVACFVGLLFVRMLYWFEDLFEAIPIAEWVKPALGGVLVGVIGLHSRDLLGVGYGHAYRAMEDALAGRQTVMAAVLMLLALKILASSVSLGSGGSGGIFAPSLFMGAMLGSGFGLLVQRLIPGLVSSPGAYALVGMGAVFAATSHAPITAVIILFELTGDYRLILPLMFACGLSTFLSRRISSTSIYTLKLVRRGVHISLGRDVGLLNTIKVEEAMTTDMICIKPDMSVRAAARLLQETKHHGFPIVDEHGILHGLITLTDVRRALDEGRADEPAIDAATHRLVVAFPDESLNDALRKLGLRDVGRLPVVQRSDHKRIVGLVTRKNIIEAYNRALVREHPALDVAGDTEMFE